MEQTPHLQITPLEKRVLQDPDLSLLALKARAYFERKAAETKPSLENRILADPDLPFLAQKARVWLASQETAVAPVQVPLPPKEAITEPAPSAIVQEPSISKDSQKQTSLETLQKRINQIGQQLKGAPVKTRQKLAAELKTLQWNLHEVKKGAAEIVSNVPRKKAAWGVAGLGALGLGVLERPAISTTVAQAFSATRAAIVQPAALPSYGITEEADTFETQQQVKPVTFGTLLSEKPTFFRPGTNEQINPLAGERQIEVLRPAGRGRFLVQTSTGQLEIPMEQIDVQGNFSWEKEIKPLEWLGFDTVVPQLIDRIPEIGAGVVRIPVEKADKSFFAEHPWVVESIKRAQEKNLEILLLFNPTKLLNEEETTKRIDDILSLVNGYDKVLFELGNEPDLWPFWENQDLHTYAQFVDMASKILWQRKPDARIVVAATSQEKAIQPLVNILKTSGIDTSKFIYSLHAYQNENDVKERIKLLKQVIGDDGKFLFDEIGVNTSDQDKAERVPKMIAEARRNGSLYVIIFQLWNVPFEGGADRGRWGFVDYDGRFELPAWSLVNFAWEQTHK